MNNNKGSDPWGFDILDTALRSNNYGWETRSESEKRYILTDLHLYIGKFTVLSLAANWRGTGHSEWEYLLAAWLITSIDDALANDKREADISIMFTRDLIASHNRRFTKEQVHERIMPLFDIINEDDENIYLRLRVK